ncbi:hypothetical protein AKJ38_00500 [candidate division MSBL1 archaeon SCGC-AAA259I14]|uniref:Uncharacterized protein n=1 Tax=candidate division MSBL1 archaeon SCGC-AAA259I14 TaxID=1698268 RepID=A0A133UU79_9EURY|nr:hypothetical protein AKJ38_00500 [candidate division MSBL1 archaeon SCGC-AAA259I14]
MKRAEEFSTCPLCGSDVKLKNMLEHKFKVHKEEMDAGGEGSLREEGGVTDTELKVACDKASDMMSDGEFREAAKLFKKIVEAEPEDFGAWNDLGFCMKKLNEPDKALNSFEKSIEANPEFGHGWLQKGNILFTEKENFDGARECYEEALKHDPKLLQAWHNLGNVHMKMGEFEKAMRCFDEAIDLNNEYYMAWMSKWQALEKLGKSEEARECFEKAYDLNPRYVRKCVDALEAGSTNITEESDMLPKEDGGKR